MVARRITAIRDEAEGVCIVDLDCGHSRHVRDRPPLESHPWVRDPDERQRRIGSSIECGICRDAASSRPGSPTRSNS